MSLPYRSTPFKGIDDLHQYYGEKEAKQTPYYLKLKQATKDLKEIVSSQDFTKNGLVISIEGTWGSGKTSFVQLLCDDLIEENVAIVKYDSLYYGNVSEATDIFIKSIFEEVKEKFGVKLSSGASIAKNITPKFEISTGLPKFSLDYKIGRPPTEVIKGQLEAKLNRLPGKMVVIIDDIDRVAANDVVHFLRLVRVLRELPNFVVILPIDRTMLENLLKSQGVQSPRRYLEKIVDHSYDINPEQGSSKDLFGKILKKKFPKKDISDELTNLMWDLYLWEVSLATIKNYEINGQQRFILNVGTTDPLWQMLNPVVAQNGENIIRKFFEQTSSAYGADANYVFRIKNAVNPNEDVFQHYSQVFANMTFTDLMYNRFFPNLSTDLVLDNTNGADLLNMRWWSDKEGLITMQSAPDKSQKTDYRLEVPTDETQRTTYYEDINSKAHYMWDTIRSLAGEYFPEIALQYLAPRTLNRIIDSLEVDFNLIKDASRSEDYVELHRSMRKSVQKVIVFVVDQ